MATEVILPKVDMDMATGRISRWLVAEGAAVKQGDPRERETERLRCLKGTAEPSEVQA